MQFQNKTIWITGASSGIGKALALEWAKYSPKLVLSGRNKEKLEEVSKACEAIGAKCQIVILDLAEPKSIEQAAKTVMETYSSIDILVNNGGISQRASAVETPVDVDRKIMETNFFGAITLTKEVLPTMVSNQKGHIVVVSSIVGKFGFPLRTAYSASKHALQGYFESLRAELKPDNINVTIVSPGRISTNISLNAIDKDGAKHGVMDPGQANGMPSDVCARKIINAIRRKKKDFLVGGSELIMVKIRKFLPALYYKMASKVKPT
jgi:dehydrogenase/reductase SDR family member 7B